MLCLSPYFRRLVVLTQGSTLQRTMPTRIVTETCPAPECNLTAQFKVGVAIQPSCACATRRIIPSVSHNWSPRSPRRVGPPHMLLVALAHHFLVRLRVHFQHLARALTVYQVRLLLTSVLPRPVFDPVTALQIKVFRSGRSRSRLDRIGG